MSLLAWLAWRGRDRGWPRPDGLGRPLSASAMMPSHSPEWYAYVERAVRDARQVRFISMGLQILFEGEILGLLLTRARQGLADVTVCMANPYNPAVVDRLVEEEIAQKRPQTGRQGIIRNIMAVLDQLDKENNPASFRVLLFEHYPTVATYIIDDNVMVVPYVYQRLGHQAPLLHLRSDRDDEVASFFVANAERVLRDAVPAADIIASQPDRRHIQADWIQACVSIVPDGSEPLYQFGSSVTGFDLRSEAATEQALLDGGEHAECVGDARLEGFHAPLVEPLYFANEAGIDRIAAELSMLAEESPRLTLSNPRVEDRTHTFGGIVLRCDEPSGVAEALHGELVSRVYKRAVTSRYLLTRDMMIGGSESAPGRGSLMIRRYGTPYVFNRFDVHFLLSASPPMDPIVRRSLVEQLEDLRREYVPSADVEIDRVYLLVRRPADLHWRIHKAYRLLGS